MSDWDKDAEILALDRTLIWNQRHLLHALREFEQSYNAHRPHLGIANARSLSALPAPIPELAAATRLRVRRCDRIGGILHEYQERYSKPPCDREEEKRAGGIECVVVSGVRAAIVGVQHLPVLEVGYEPLDWCAKRRDLGVVFLVGQG